MHRIFLILIIVFPIALFSFWSFERNTVYRSEVSLWEDGALKSPRKARVHYNLAYAYEREGKKAEAVTSLKKTLEIDPWLYAYMKAVEYAEKNSARVILGKDPWQ